MLVFVLSNTTISFQILTYETRVLFTKMYPLEYTLIFITCLTITVDITILMGSLPLSFGNIIMVQKVPTPCYYLVLRLDVMVFSKLPLCLNLTSQCKQ